MARSAAASSQERRLRSLHAALRQHGATAATSALPERIHPGHPSRPSAAASVAVHDHAVPIFRPEVAATFDHDTFLRTGFHAFPAIMTTEAQNQWTSACKEVQAANDSLITDTDWGCVDWEGAGLAAPPADAVTAEVKQSMKGGCQIAGYPIKAKGYSPHLHRQIDGLAFGWGGFPEHNAVEYSQFLRHACTHSDMIALQCAVLGVAPSPDELRFDHGLILNRKHGFKGQNWHSHSYKQEGAADYTEQQDPRFGGALVRMLCYPEGFKSDPEEGGLGVIPGSHLASGYCRGFDDAGVNEWLRGKEGADGAALGPMRLSLPPGSVVVIHCYTVHSVAPHTVDGAAPRFASLFCFRRRATGPARSRWVSARFEEAVLEHADVAQQLGIPDRARQLFADDGDEP